MENTEDVMLAAAAQWCPIVVSSVSIFSCTCYNVILSFTFIHIYSLLLFHVVDHEIAFDLPLRYTF